MPIRYVVAVILVVSLLGISFSGIDNIAKDNSRQQMDAEIQKLEDTSLSLLKNEELPPRGQPGPRRHITIELPDDSLTSEPIEFVYFTRVNQTGSLVEYKLEEGSTQQRFIEVPLVYGNSDTFRLTGSGQTINLVLTMEPNENGNPIINIGRANGLQNLLVESDTGGNVVVSPPGVLREEWNESYEQSTTVELSAMSQNGYTFEGWRGDVNQPANKTITVEMNNDKKITAMFSESD